MRSTVLTACCYLAGTLFFVAGCDNKGSDYKEVPTGKKKAADTFGDPHDHAHAHGPHDGHIIELGAHEYHAELVLNDKTKTIGVYLYDRDLKKPEPIDAKSVTLNLVVEGKPTPLELQAKPQQGESDGKSSYFEVALPKEVAEHVDDIEHVAGELQLTIGGKPYTGALKPHDHGHEAGHKHDDKKGEHKDGDHKHDDHAQDADHKHEDHKDGDHKESDHKHDEKEGEHKDGDTK